MALITLGINHQTAPVELREQVAFTSARLPVALRELRQLPSVSESAIISTCNRTELYCYGNQTDSGRLSKWLSDFHGLKDDIIQPYLYKYTDKEAVRHILRVAGGLDSLILGEPQILGQVKQAYHQANNAGTLDFLLSRLFQHTFSVAKQIRTDTSIGESPVSVAFAAVRLAKQFFSRFEEHTALLIGAGETIELTARHLHEQGLGRIIIANRTLSNARHLAAQFEGYAIDLEEIPVHLAEADIVISSTACEHAILTAETVRQALKKRRHKPVFMVDIAVPRDIDPDIAKFDDIYLYTVDDLTEVIQENMKSRQQAALQAEEIVDTQVDKFMAWLRGQDAVGSIRLFRSRAEAERDQVLEKARQMLASGKPPEAAIEFIANTLTNKLLHQPTIRLRAAAAENQHEIIRAAIELFDLKEE